VCLDALLAHRQRQAADRVQAWPDWADEPAVRELTSEAYAVRLLDAVRQEGTPAIRQHDGTALLDYDTAYYSGQLGWYLVLLERGL
jgi:hypothetical protein